MNRWRLIEDSTPVLCLPRELAIPRGGVLR